ncbi:MAG: hypothetical protein KGH65_05625 [Candidatus Micrarchaeota archaeon]|nr:hypothetical protein [Candidatus Micrarchaeota archaeon]
MNIAQQVEFQRLKDRVATLEAILASDTHPETHLMVPPTQLSVTQLAERLEAVEAWIAARKPGPKPRHE